MAAHDRHHYVPRFLLNAWAGPAGHKNQMLWAFYWVRDNQFQHQPYSPTEAGKVHGLYALQDDPDYNRIEREFFGKVVDTPGSVAHRAICNKGVDGLTDEERENWSRFIMLQLTRVPEMIELARTIGAARIQKEWPDCPENSTAYADIAPLMMTKLWRPDGEWNRIFRGATWTIREVALSTVDLLIGDNPLMYFGSMQTSFLIALPLTPRRVFFAYNDVQMNHEFANKSDSELVEYLNQRTVKQATQYVYATDKKQSEFIQEHLRHGVPR